MVVNEGYQAVPVWSTTEKRNLSKEVSPGIVCSVGIKSESVG